MPYQNRGGRALAGVRVRTVVLLFIPAFACAETNVSSNAAARARDDRSGMVNLALQVVQQLQAQQQTNLTVIGEVKQSAEASSKQTAASVASLRRLVLFTGVLLAVGIAGLFFYARRLFRSLQQRVTIAAPIDLGNTARVGSPKIAGLVSQLLVRGQVLIDQKQAVAALACFDQAIALEINSAEAHVKRGLALEQLGRFEDALASFDHALALDPRFADAYVGKGDALNRLERYEEALVCFDCATRLQPNPGGPNPHVPTQVAGDSR